MMSMMKRKIGYKSLQIYSKRKGKSQYNKPKNKDDDANQSCSISNTNIYRTILCNT